MPEIFPDPPQRMKWRVCRFDAVKAVVAGQFAKISEDMMIFNRHVWGHGPRGFGCLTPREAAQVEGGTPSDTAEGVLSQVAAGQVIILLREKHIGFEEAE
jgi:hypothetical protein